MKPPIKDSVVMITGASSGIGEAMARQLASSVRTLLLVARREARLRQLEDELKQRHPQLEVHVLPCDLSLEEEVSRLLQTLEEQALKVEVLINNAGLGDIALFEATSWGKLDQLLKVNMLALTRLTYHLLGPMLERGRGGILNVSSTLGLIFMPAASVYAATKNFVSAFSEGLRLELRGTGVVVSHLCPGPVDTEFESISGKPAGHAVPGLIKISAEQCARVGLRGFSRGQALIIPGLLMRLLMGLARLAPRPLLRLVFSGVGHYLRRRAQV